MDGQNQSTSKEAAEASGEGRQRSTIGFPYSDLDSVAAMAQAIFDQVGGGECDDAQLAAWTDQSNKSSGFRVQVSAARMFGVLEGEGSHHRLSDLGLSLVDTQREKEARAEAFLKIPLYRAAFEDFKGRQLPPAAALERVFVDYGVAPKQKGRARQVFERSADQAGYFAHGRDRLVRPGVKHDPGGTKDEGSKGNRNGGGSGGDGGDGGGKDPLLAALIEKLPKPQQDKPWQLSERVTWLKMAAMAFDMTYGSAGEIRIDPAVPAKEAE